jgi:hypothetical protein
MTSDLWGRTVVLPPGADQTTVKGWLMTPNLQNIRNSNDYKISSCIIIKSITIVKVKSVSSVWCVLVWYRDVYW